MINLINKLIKKKQFVLKSDGTSMLPTIFPSDVVSLKKVGFKNIRTNDIVLVNKDKRSFIHRVIFRSPPPRGSPLGHPRGVLTAYLITKGDNNQKSDGKIYPQQIMGKVYQIKRNRQVFSPQDINLFQSTLYFQEIIKVKKVFEKEGIDFVFLKGLPIHLYYEGRHPTRIYADCDLLIKKADYEKVEKIFKKFKYNKAKTEYSSIHKILKDKPTEFSFYRKISDFPVVFDIHFEPVFLMNQLGRLDELYPQKLIDEMMIEFLRTKRKVTIQNESFLILNTYYLILYLALHFFHHNYRGIYRLEMIDKIIRRAFKVPPPSGEPLRVTSPSVSLSLSRKVKYYKVQNFIYPVFLMIKKYFNTPLPRGFLSSIKPKEDKVKYIKKNIMKINIFDDEPKVQAGINRFLNIFYLSSEPMIKKVLVFANLAVIYSAVWVLYKKFFQLTKLSFLKLNPAKVR